MCSRVCEFAVVTKERLLVGDRLENVELCVDEHAAVERDALKRLLDEIVRPCCLGGRPIVQLTCLACQPAERLRDQEADKRIGPRHRTELNRAQNAVEEILKLIGMV